MITFFKTLIYIPLYNILVLLLNIKWVDAGIATVILTVLVKIVLYPLAKKATVTQIRMKEKEGELSLLKEKYKNKDEQALKVMEFYKTNNINPFSSILTIIIQIPIILSLYYIFLKSGLPVINNSLLYSFVKAPMTVSMNFLGLIDISQKSILLAILAAVASFLQMHFSNLTTKNTNKNQAGDKEDFANMLNKQMKYTMPLIVFFISWRISGVVALYWFISNLFGIIQDAYTRRNLAKTSLTTK